SRKSSLLYRACVQKHRFAVATGYLSIMLPVYLPAGTFPYSFFTFLPGCYAGAGDALFSSQTSVEINNIRRRFS
ncbi:hypothetical protein ACM3VP_004823, partial [Escherichia coli]